MQTIELKLEKSEPAQFMKIIFQSGSGLFAAVYNINFLDI